MMTEQARILRYVIPIDDREHEVPDGIVELVAPERQGSGSAVEVWILVRLDEQRTQHLRVFGTGQHIDLNEWWPCGSCIDRRFVWHMCAKF